MAIRKISKKDRETPIEPNPNQLNNAVRCGWEYDSESFLFIKDDILGFYSLDGFQKH